MRMSLWNQYINCPLDEIQQATQTIICSYDCCLESTAAHVRSNSTRHCSLLHKRLLLVNSALELSLGK